MPLSYRRAKAHGLVKRTGVRYMKVPYVYMSFIGPKKGDGRCVLVGERRRGLVQGNSSQSPNVGEFAATVGVNPH